ncbi:MAG: stage II sporulation protein R [Clostridiales bacterium]|jgi:stage II sporulation protein R|nr:stage II sporulation protein R [Clostridiales bacterium]
MDMIKNWLYEHRIMMLLSVIIGVAWLFLHATAIAGSQDGEARHINQVLRLHILAHDDTPREQALKLAVRDGIWAYMYDVGNRAASLDEAREIVAENLPYIEAAARRIVQSYGGTEHGVTARLAENQAFPAMSYAGIIFPQGRYEALQITIGAGAGSNWWCVMFPAMCLMEVTQAEVVEAPSSGATAVRPRFRLAEAWRSIFD